MGEKARVDDGQGVLRRQPMGWRKSSEHRICFDQGRRGDDERFPLCNSAFHLRDRALMMLMPGAYRGDHDAGIGEKATHAGLGGGCSIAGQLSACLFDGLVRESLD